MLTQLLVAFSATAAADSDFVFSMQTDVRGVGTCGEGVVKINVTSSLAPLGAAHLKLLLNDSFYDGAAFFRVVPNFVVQFGIAGEPKENAKWAKAIVDDPVIGSNTEGTLSYATAGPNTRTTQLFINLVNNSRLDKMGFAPLGRVVCGMDVVRSISNPTPGQSGGVDQAEYTAKGDAWIRKAYPDINFILASAEASAEANSNKACTCMHPGPGKASFTQPGNCSSHEPQYEKLCATETEEYDCEQQTLVRCYWRPHGCTKDEDCKRYCAYPMCI